jgi:hypothetical protein
MGIGAIPAENRSGQSRINIGRNGTDESVPRYEPWDRQKLFLVPITRFASEHGLQPCRLGRAAYALFFFGFFFSRFGAFLFPMLKA